MPYTPQVWHDQPVLDTPISASRLAHLEAGVQTAQATAESGHLDLEVAYSSLATPVSGGFDWSAATAQMLTDGAAQGVKRFVIPNQGTTYQFSSGFTVPQDAEVICLGKPTLDFTLLGNGTGITLSKNAVLENAIINGSSSANTGKGVAFNGDFQFLRHCTVQNWGTLLDFVHNNTYITTVESCRFLNGGLVADLQLAGVTNSGERMMFRDCILSNSADLVKTSGSNTNVFFEGCSLDYPTNSMGVFNSGQVYFSNCHIETSSATSAQAYLFQKTGCNLFFSNTEFFLAGINFVIDRTTEGTGGFVGYTGCRAWFKNTAGTNVNQDSEVQVFVAAGGTTATFDSPFISRTVIASVAMALHSGNAALAITPPAVSFAASSTLATLTYASTVPSNAVAIVRFG